MIFQIPEVHIFPSPELAEPNGLLGIGGDLHPDRVLLALREGIFPWYSNGQPILWFSPDPRYVLMPDRLHISKSLAKSIRKNPYEIKIDTDFVQVIEQCATVSRTGQKGTWITDEMIRAYCSLFEQGHAHSFEAWDSDRLVGGLYCVSVGGYIDGESMFALEPDASKIAFVWMVRQVQLWGYELIDCQVHTQHLERFGAEHISRQAYIQLIRRLGQSEIKQAGPWAFDEDFWPL
ncbi:MAG: leucyl/phenylalanyl-tRNA--protein transferase [Myxococcota bacterium]|nr:leucyl/phenylalanyl-tRNA--protein transferase [Myxococcota bacterium]